MKLYKLSIFLIFSGIILAVIFSFLGYAHFALFIIFPVIYSDNPISAIPFALIFIGILLLMLSPFATPVEYRRERGEPEFQRPPYEHVQEKKERKFGGVILIGPIPIIIGNDRKLLYVAGAIAIIILLIFLFYYFGR